MYLWGVLFACIHVVCGSSNLQEYAYSSGLAKDVLHLPDIREIYNSSYSAYLSGKELTPQRTSPSNILIPEMFPSALISVPLGSTSDQMQYTIRQNVQVTKFPVTFQVLDHVLLSTSTGDLIILAKSFCDVYGFNGPCVAFEEPSQNLRPAMNRDGLITIWFDDQTLQCLNCVYFPPSVFEQNVQHVNSMQGEVTAGANISKSYNFNVRDEYEPIYWESSSYRGMAGYSNFVDYIDLKESQGIAGLGYSTLHDVARAQPLLHLLLQSTGLKDPYTQVKSNTLRQTYGLDLNKDEPSHLYVGGASDLYRGLLEWTDNPQTVDTAAFQAKEQSICGRVLVSDVLVTIDTLNPCLSLPERLFDFFISWLHVECYGAPYNPEKLICKFRGDTTQELPTLEFRVNSYGSALYIPLRSLLIGNTTQLCVRRSMLPYIHFGTQPLTALYTQIDMSDRTVGFANKLRSSPMYNQCLPRVQCKHMQTSYAAYNGCIAPRCKDYYLFNTSTDGTECVVSAGLHVFVACILGFFLLIEGMIWGLEYFKQQQVLQTAPHLTLEWVAEHIQLEQDADQQQQQPSPQ